jgi:hypothetical protein
MAVQSRRIVARGAGARGFSWPCNVYLAGPTQSTDFPTTPGAFQPKYGGGFFDAFAAKLSADGSRLRYATYLGGTGDDRAEGLAIDAAGSAYVLGRTKSGDFPTTPGAFDTTYNGSQDVYIAKLGPAGDKLGYATYLGGSLGEDPGAITVDRAGAAFITGNTQSPDFPSTPGAFDPTYNGGIDGFAAKLLADGSGLAYATFLGGSVTEGAGPVAVDGAGDAYVTGGTNSPDFPITRGAFQTKLAGSFDVYVTELTPEGDKLVYSTYLGGKYLDDPNGVAVDATGVATVAGSTGSADFPVTPNALQKGNADFSAGFITQLKPGGSGLLYSTYLGGASTDAIEAMAMDAGGDVYVTGTTKSTNFPTTPGAYQTNKVNDPSENAAFVTELKAASSAHVPPGRRPLGAPGGAGGSRCCGGP